MSVKCTLVFWLSFITMTLMKPTLSTSDFMDPHCEGKQVIVQLFEWRFVDIAEECERFLGDKDFCGVQVSPINEHRIIEPGRPWYERYQPVSYKIQSRSGNETEFIDMVVRCNNVGVRIYVDVVLNHMTEVGVSGIGTAGSVFNSGNLTFPGIPYNKTHFHDQNNCHTSGVLDQADRIRECNKDKHREADLDQTQLFVRNKMAEYLNHLIDLGVAGFRIDSAQFMKPEDILAIQKLTKSLPEGGQPLFINSVNNNDQNVIKMNEYYGNGYVTDFKYSRTLASGIWDFSSLKSSILSPQKHHDADHLVVFVDNHETQREDVSNVLTHNTVRDYKMATALMLADNYGFARVMSSYNFGYDLSRGPPEHSNHSIKETITDIHNQGQCGNNWVCEHRWRPISNMVAFRNAVVGTEKRHIRVTNNEVSFARGSKGFFAMAKNGSMNATLHTGLPVGSYCDLITECKKVIHVNEHGEALIQIHNLQEPIVAFIVDGPLSHPNQHQILHIGNVIGSHNTSLPPSLPHSTTQPKTTTTTVSTDATTVSSASCKNFTRTIIFFHDRTVNGQDLFIRGGIDDRHTSGCQLPNATNNCSIPIRSNQIGNGSHFDAYNAWRQGDNYLDWYGPEPHQGSYNGRVGQGTPAVWTTNIPSDPRYNPLNRFGDHYWLVDLDIDCCRTINGWFEIKARLNLQWENNVLQGIRACDKTEFVPYENVNHWAKCGMMNVFQFDDEQCQILPIPKV